MLFGNCLLADLQLDDFDPLIVNTEPDGLCICVPAEQKDQPEIVSGLSGGEGETSGNPK